MKIKKSEAPNARQGRVMKADSVAGVATEPEGKKKLRESFIL